MFFSPSAVKSYIKYNSIGNSICFCIGETTSSFVKKFSKKTYFSENPSIENVVKQTINSFK
jgi:uroporphyrinogen-III synthase